MNSILKDGEVFTLKNLLPYQDGKIVNMDLIDQEKDKDKLKLTVMSFAAGTALPEHTISAEALLCALDGEAYHSRRGKFQICQRCNAFGAGGKTVQNGTADHAGIIPCPMLE